jgi:hypothetical protein
LLFLSIATSYIITKKHKIPKKTVQRSAEGKIDGSTTVERKEDKYLKSS